MADLTLRAKRILNAVVQEYLSSGDAVGSRTVTRRYGIDLSPATVRNVMADLEDLGLLKQPHTSAGRVPTTDGLRFFIDSLLKVRSLSTKEKDELRTRYGLPAPDLDEVLQRTSRMLSELSQQAVIVTSPMPERQRLQHLEFVRLREGELLAVLVTDGGQVENKLVKIDVPIDAATVERVNNYLNELLGGKTLEEVRQTVLEELAGAKAKLDELTARALRLGHAAFAQETTPDVIVSGSAHLLDRANDGGLEKTRALLTALEEKERI